METFLLNLKCLTRIYTVNILFPYCIQVSQNASSILASRKMNYDDGWGDLSRTNPILFRLVYKVAALKS